MYQLECVHSLYKGFIVLIAYIHSLALKMGLNNNDFYQFDVGHDQFYPGF